MVLALPLVCEFVDNGEKCGHESLLQMLVCEIREYCTILDNAGKDWDVGTRFNPSSRGITFGISGLASLLVVRFRQSHCTSRTSEVKWRHQNSTTPPKISTALSRITRLSSNIAMIASSRERQVADDEGRRGKGTFVKLRLAATSGQQEMGGGGSSRGEIKCGSLFQEGC